VRTAFVTGGSGFIGARLIERLAGDGWTVRALARSDAAAAKVTAGGAEVAFHAAAKVEDWGDIREFRRINVEGTNAVLDACRVADVRRFVHVGTEAALLHGQPLVMADERTPLAFHSRSPYSATKAEAEAVALAARGIEVVVVRPRFVWGPNDTTLIPAMIDLVESGRFRWIGGGRQLTSTTHLDNCVEGLVLAADRGTPGAAYFVTDGELVVLHDFVSALLATRGVHTPESSIPRPVAVAAAWATETAWRLLRRTDHPPLTSFAVWIASLECTLDDSRARADLGYEPVISRAEGLAALRG
jgi:nucleoside-diphosphate-sugar epimerase